MSPAAGLLAAAFAILLAAAPALAQEPALVTVRGVTVTREGESVAVRVATSGPPRWRTEAWGEPFRIVVDLDGATYRLPEAPATGLVEPVREIRGSQFRKGIARVVIVLTRRTDFAVEPDDAGLRVVFSRAPSRSAATPGPGAGPSRAPAAGPGPARALVYGIVLRDEGAVAYLWDPATKQTTPYKVGDAFAGGVVETIEERRVVVRGAAGPMELRLDDPKPDAPPRKN